MFILHKYFYNQIPANTSSWSCLHIPKVTCCFVATGPPVPNTSCLLLAYTTSIYVYLWYTLKCLFVTMNNFDKHWFENVGPN